jgi:ribosomal protein L7/L12
MSNRTVHIPPEAAAAIARGQLVEAIRIVRARNALDLKSAKEAVDAYVAGHAGNARQVGLRPTRSLDFPAEASAALARGDLIEAVKLVRQANAQLGLKDAKDIVDQFRAGMSPVATPHAHPRRMPTVVQGDRGLGGWMALIAVVVITFAWWLLSL